MAHLCDGAARSGIQLHVRVSDGAIFASERPRHRRLLHDPPQHHSERGLEMVRGGSRTRRLAVLRVPACRSEE